MMCHWTISNTYNFVYTFIWKCTECTQYVCKHMTFYKLYDNFQKSIVRINCEKRDRFSEERLGVNV
jgi:hypothetical protein